MADTEIVGLQSLAISCRGGLEESIEKIEFGTNYPGFARVLQNFEPSIGGGYRRINGYIKYDSAVVPGTTSEPVTGVKVAIGGVYAVRKLIADNAIYFSSGSGWGAKLNAAGRAGSINKSRFISYSITEPVVILTDGTNPAWKHNGAAETVINGSGAPTAPKYAAMHLSRLVLAPGSNSSSITLSAPNADTDFTAASGAIELNVGDVVTGLYTFRDTLYIFCRNSIKRLEGDSSTNFTIKKVTDSIGLLSHDTIQEVAGDLLFLSTDGVRPISATERVGDIELASLSNSIQELLSDDILGSFTEQYFSSCVVRKKSQYRLFINNTNTTEQNNANFLARFSRGASGHSIEWATLVGFRPFCADSEYATDQNELSVFGHPTSGYVYRMESGNDFDGTDIEWIYSTPYLTFNGDVKIRKVLHKIDLFTEFEGDFTMSVDVNFDYDSANVVQPIAIQLETEGSFSLYGTAVYGTDIYSEFDSSNLEANLIGSGNTASISFTGAGGAPFIIDSINILYAAKGRR